MTAKKKKKALKPKLVVCYNKALEGNPIELDPIIGNSITKSTFSSMAAVNAALIEDAEQMEAGCDGSWDPCEGGDYWVFELKAVKHVRGARGPVVWTVTD